MSFVDAREAILALGREAGLDCDPLRVFQKMGAGGGVREAMVERARRLRATGLRTALVTNNAREFRERWRALVPADELFEHVVDSSEVGVRKPDPAIFRIALARLGDPAPERTLFVDDYEGNLVGRARARPAHAARRRRPGARARRAGRDPRGPARAGPMSDAEAPRRATPPTRSAPSKRRSSPRAGPSSSRPRTCSASRSASSRTARARCASCLLRSAAHGAKEYVVYDDRRLTYAQHFAARGLGRGRAARPLRRAARRPRRDPRRELPRVDDLVLGRDEPRRRRGRAQRLVDRRRDPLRHRRLRPEARDRRPRSGSRASTAPSAGRAGRRDRARLRRARRARAERAAARRTTIAEDDPAVHPLHERHDGPAEGRRDDAPRDLRARHAQPVQRDAQRARRRARAAQSGARPAAAPRRRPARPARS